MFEIEHIVLLTAQRPHSSRGVIALLLPVLVALAAKTAGGVQVHFACFAAMVLIINRSVCACG
jgi:hypothetical protein